MSNPKDNQARDTETFDLLVAGKAQGLRRLLEDHGGYVREHLKRKFGHLLDDWQIDKVMSLATTRAWQSASRFDPAYCQLRAWFAVLARTCMLSLLAQHRDQPFVPMDGIDPTALGIASSKEEARRIQLIVDVHRTINGMPPLQREVLLAELNAGATLPDPLLAERLGAPTQAIYSARTSGRRNLRLGLESLGHSESPATRMPRHQTPQLPPESTR